MQVTTVSTGFALLLTMIPVTLTQSTYQRSCDCEYMVNGKCAYTLLIPTGDSCGAGGSGGNWELEKSLANLTVRVNTLIDGEVAQGRTIDRVQEMVSILQLALNVSGPNLTGNLDSLMNLSAEFKSGMAEVARLRADMENLNATHSQLSNRVDGLNVQLLLLQSELNETRQNLTTMEANDQVQNARIDDLTAKVQMLKKTSCLQRGTLFTGPNRLNTTNVTLSSTYNNQTDLYGPAHVAIDNDASPGAWCPSEPNNNEYVQFDFGRPVLVFGTVTRGRPGYGQWVTSYTVRYVPDNETESAVLAWTSFTDVLGSEEVFQGNINETLVNWNIFWRPIITRYIRIIPLSASTPGGNKCMRADVIGCVDQ